MTIVPLYDTLGNEGIRFIFDQTEMRTIALSKERLPKILKLKEEDSKLPQAE